MQPPPPGKSKQRLSRSWTTPPPSAHDPYRPWLGDRGSLTARIAARCREFHVQRVFQGLRRPHCDEAALVGLHSGRLAHVREVVLLADDVPVVFAHSIVPPEDLRGAWRSLGRLGCRPLASALFANPRVLRAPLEYQRIARRHPLLECVAESGLVARPTLWARRSLFYLGTRPLLVTEVFLPAILELNARITVIATGKRDL